MLRRLPHLFELVLVFVLHQAHATLHLGYLRLLLIVRDLKSLGLRQLGLVCLSAFFDIFCITHVSLSLGVVRSWVLWMVILRRVVALLAVELGVHLIVLLSVAALGHHLRVVHVVLLGHDVTLLWLWSLLLLTLKHKLDHFELLVLQGSHLSHLLLMDPLGLLEHARMAACGLRLHFDDTPLGLCLSVGGLSVEGGLRRWLWCLHN